MDEPFVYVEDFDIHISSVIGDVSNANGTFEIRGVPQQGARAPRSAMKVNLECFPHPQSFLSLQRNRIIDEETFLSYELMPDEDFQRRFPEESITPSCPHCVFDPNQAMS